ncbi:MAG: hypothetical protein CL853_07825 [Crocinitomicaceae bacterium]|nr:hypothetical protein [Crocinitomicaceae bacterium]|tara:strand:+ start:2451 stop:2816 length:366 start_codon:yes stop_codon:yes gene_type:complete
MSLTIKGQLVRILDPESGTSKAGKQWKKQSFLVNTGAQYNPEICFQLFGEDKIQMLDGINSGDQIEVSFNISSREYNGRYFHNIDAWKITKETIADNNPESISPDLDLEPLGEDEADDLPF